MTVTPVGTAKQGGGTGLVSSATVTLATGVSTGDLDIFSITVQGAGLATATPTGWTQVAAVTDGTGAQMSTYARLRQAGDPASITVSFTGGTSQHGWAAGAYTGVHQSTPLGTPTTFDDTVNDTTVPTPALTTIHPGSYRVITAGIGGSATYTAMPTGYTEVIQCTSGKRTIITHAANSAAGTTAASSFTLSASARGITHHFEVNPASASNTPPTANAGADQTVAVGAAVTVGGTDTDPDGSIASIAWTQLSGATVTLSSSTTASPTFTAPGSPSTIVLRKTVTDNLGATGTDDVTVTVQTAIAAVTPTGVAQAGALTSAGSSVTVTLATGATGSGIYDVFAVTVQGAGVSTATPSGWTLIDDCLDGSGVDIRTYGRRRTGTDPSTVAVTITGGTSQAGWAAAAYNGVHVNPAFGTPTQLATAVVQTAINVPALTTTKTGSYRIVTSGLGSGSSSFDVMPSGYTQVAQNAGGKRTILAHAANASAGTTAASSFTVSAAVRGATSHFELWPASLTNEAPTANAGVDQTVEPWSTVTLTGAGSSDPDGSVASYAWAQLSGATVTLSSSSAVSPTFTAPAAEAGNTLVFGLTVTDDSGTASAQDSVTVTVLPATEFCLSAGGVWTPMQTVTL